MSHLIYSDPNCTASDKWSAWLAAIHESVVFGVESAEVGHPAAEMAQAADAEAARLQLGTDDIEVCQLGVATYILSQVSRSWRGGQFFAALHLFAILHDEFLTNVHPGFIRTSAWPLHDLAVQAWKDQFLWQVRRFRQLAGRHLHLGDAAFKEANMPDLTDRINLGGVGSPVLQQLVQRQLRESWSNFSHRSADTTTSAAAAAAAVGTASRGSPGRRPEYIPTWEVSPLAAIVPTTRVEPDIRIYVYGPQDVAGVEDLTVSPAFCHYRQWGMDVGFHDFFRTSPLRTFDPQEADYFFVPSYACCHQVAGIYDFEDLDAKHISVVERLPYFQRSGGEDHLFSFHYVDLFPSWRKFIPKSIFLTPETEVGFERSLEEFSVDQLHFPPFDSLKDLSVPPFLNAKDVLGFHRNAKPIQSRTYLAAFAGKLWTDVTEAADTRSKVARLGNIPGVAIHAFSTIKNMLGSEQLQEFMGNARFCLAPRGRAAWSVRFFETLWAGCVPVILSDHYQPPFAQLFDLSEFAIKWPVSKIDESLVQYLQSIPIEVVEKYVQAAQRVRCWYLFPPPEVAWLGSWEARRELDLLEEEVCPGLSSSRNAFQAVVEVLARKKRATRAGRHQFYMPDPGQNFKSAIVDEDLNPL